MIPLLVFGLGIRREMSKRVTAEYEQRVAALVNVINADITRESDRIGARLAALKSSLENDNNFRNVVVRVRIAPTCWTTRAMRCVWRASIFCNCRTTGGASSRRPFPQRV